jgi:hypothetical protein
VAIGNEKWGVWSYLTLPYDLLSCYPPGENSTATPYVPPSPDPSAPPPTSGPTVPSPTATVPPDAPLQFRFGPNNQLICDHRGISLENVSLNEIQVNRMKVPVPQGTQGSTGGPPANSDLILVYSISGLTGDYTTGNALPKIWTTADTVAQALQVII